jgi:transcriptional regulator with GAF, ATPase, and Fis domain
MQVALRHHFVGDPPDVLQLRSSSVRQGIIGSSILLQRVMQQVNSVPPTDSSVFIQGETGAGKELIARATHDALCSPALESHLPLEKQ